MIIQCPSCSTKFSVDAAQLADVENPRFHCSRCDHFFEVTPQSASEEKFASEKRSPAPSVSVPREALSSPELAPNANIAELTRSLIEQEERAEDFEDMYLRESDAKAKSYSAGEQLDLLDSEFVPDFEDELQDASDEAPTHVRARSIAPELSADDGLGLDEEIEIRSTSSLDQTSDQRFSRGELRESSEQNAHPRRLGLRHELDIEENPGVAISWPESSTSGVFEADLRRVHSQLVSSLKSASQYQPTHVSTDYRNERETSQAYSSENNPEQDLRNPVSSRPVEIETPRVEDDYSPSLTADDGSVSDVRPKRVLPAISEFDALPNPSLEHRSSPEAGRARIPNSLKQSPELLSAARAIHELPEAEPPLKISRKPKESIALEGDPLLKVSSSIDALLPASTAFAEHQEEADFSALVAKPEDIWRDSGKIGFSRTVPRETRKSNSSTLSNLAARMTSFGVAVCGSVPLALTLGAWWWSGHLEQSPEVFKKYFYLAPTGLSRVAPNGLEVKDVKSNFVTLDDGSRVLDIQGSILNSTKDYVGRVKIEAKVFDKQNKEVGRLLVDSHLGLADASIQALSAKALSEMQREHANSFVRIGPNESARFRVVFTDVGAADKPSDIQWFSTRIFSIEPLSS